MVRVWVLSLYSQDSFLEMNHCENVTKQPASKRSLAARTYDTGLESEAAVLWLSKLSQGLCGAPSNAPCLCGP